MLEKKLQEKCTALHEREAQLEAIKKERFELSIRVQHLQKEVSVVKTRNTRLEQDLLSKDAEIQQLKLNGQSKCAHCVHVVCLNTTHTHTHTHTHTYMIISKNHNSLDCEQSLGLDIKQSPNEQDTFGKRACPDYM